MIILRDMGNDFYWVVISPGKYKFVHRISYEKWVCLDDESWTFNMNSEDLENMLEKYKKKEDKKNLNRNKTV